MIRVYLHDYLERNNVKSDLLHMTVVMKPWITENVLPLKWEMDGVTRYSFRFEFLHEADAVAFKLKFGV